MPRIPKNKRECVSIAKRNILVIPRTCRRRHPHLGANYRQCLKKMRVVRDRYQKECKARIPLPRRRGRRPRRHLRRRRRHRRVVKRKRRRRRRRGQPTKKE